MGWFDTVKRIGGDILTGGGAEIGRAVGGWMDGSHDNEDRLNQAAGQYGGYAADSRNRFLSALSGGQQALNDSTRAAVANALPSYMQNLQGSRENAIRRGTSNGDLQTSFEGDLSSAFQRNVSNSIAGQAMNMYGTQVGAYGNLANNDSNNYLDLLSGNADREQAGRNARYGLVGGIIGAAGKIGAAKAGGG